MPRCLSCHFPLAHENPALADPVQSVEQRPPAGDVLDDRLHDAERRQIARQGGGVGTEVVPDAQSARDAARAAPCRYRSRRGLACVRRRSGPCRRNRRRSRRSRSPGCRTGAGARAARDPPLDTASRCCRPHRTRRTAIRRPRRHSPCGRLIVQISASVLCPTKVAPKPSQVPNSRWRRGLPQPPQVLQDRSVVGLHLPTIERLVPSGRRPGRRATVARRGRAGPPRRRFRSSPPDRPGSPWRRKDRPMTRRAQATRRPSSPTSMVLTDGCSHDAAKLPSPGSRSAKRSNRSKCVGLPSGSTFAKHQEAGLRWLIDPDSRTLDPRLGEDHPFPGGVGRAVLLRQADANASLADANAALQQEAIVGRPLAKALALQLQRHGVIPAAAWRRHHE